MDRLNRPVVQVDAAPSKARQAARRWWAALPCECACVAASHPRGFNQHTTEPVSYAGHGPDGHAADPGSLDTIVGSRVLRRVIRNTLPVLSERSAVTPQQWAQMSRAEQAEHIGHYGPPPAEWSNQPGYQTAVSEPAPVLVAPKRRKVWPWVLLAIVMIPILLFVACTALVGGAVKSVDDARKGGTVKIGETFTYASGLALTVAQPKPFDPDNQFIVDPRKEAGYEATVTVANGTKSPVGVSLILINATVNNAPAEQVFTESIPDQQIQVGQKLAVPFRFKVKKGTTGDLQIAVTDTFNEPVFFTGKLP